MTIRVITAETGRPIENATIEVYGRVGRTRIRRQIVTNKDGVAIFEQPASPGKRTLWLVATAAKYVPVSYSWGDERHDSEVPGRVELRLDRGHTIGGVVNDEAGRPIRG